MPTREGVWVSARTESAAIRISDRRSGLEVISYLSRLLCRRRCGLFEVLARERNERRPRRARRVPFLVLPEAEVAVDYGGVDRRELGRAEIPRAEQLVDRTGPDGRQETSLRIDPRVVDGY